MNPLVGLSFFQFELKVLLLSQDASGTQDLTASQSRTALDTCRR